MHKYELRVYYEDTDAQGVVYYANYLKFFERARTEYLRKSGYNQKQLMDEGAVFVVRDVNMKLMKPARLDDEIVINSSLTKLGKVSFDFIQKAYKDGTLLCEAIIRCGCVDSISFSPYPLPSNLYNQIKKSKN